MWSFRPTLWVSLFLCGVFLVVDSAPTASAAHNITYCNTVQNRIGLIRYPPGTLGVSSTEAGEMGDLMILVPRVYPCLNNVTIRPEKDDRRASVEGDPSILIVKYKADKPCGRSVAEITVTPHVSVFRLTFPENTDNKYVVLDFSKYRVDDRAELNK